MQTRAPWLLLALLLFGACKTPPGHSPGYAPSPPRGGGLSESAPTPEWVGEIPGWPRVNAIERWLADAGWDSSEFWRLEARLQLAEGLLEITDADAARGRGASSADLGAREDRARGAFSAVLAAAESTSIQRERAQEGLARLEGGAREAASPLPGLAVPLIPRDRWGASAPRPGDLTRTEGGWSRVTIHHSAEAYDPGLDGSESDSAEALRRIQRSHMGSRGYGDIGYHFLIDPQGRVFAGRSLDWQGAHAYGQNNVQNLGVCLLGNFEVDRPSPRALATLERLLEDLRAQYRIPRSRVYGHREFRNSECPGQHLFSWVLAYRR